MPHTVTAPAARETDYPTENVQIIAPAAPGDGWDTTAREFQAALQSEVIDEVAPPARPTDQGRCRSRPRSSNGWWRKGAW